MTGLPARPRALRAIRSLIVATTALVAACNGHDVTGPGVIDPTLPGGPKPTLPAVGPNGEILVTCTLDGPSRTLACGGLPNGPTTSAARDLIVGKPYAQLSGGAMTYTLGTDCSAVVNPLKACYSIPISVQNLIPQLMGTTDGVTPTATGVQVFFVTLPTTSAGTGAITLFNPTGTAVFLSSGAPYFQYSGTALGADAMLATNEVSVGTPWKFESDATVTGFTFQVYVSAAVPKPNGWVDLALTNGGTAITATSLASGASVTLFGTARAAVGYALPAEDVGTISFASSDPTVATVDATTGAVSALATGTTTITASATKTAGPVITGSVAVTVTPGTPANMVKSAGDAQTGTAGNAVATAPAVTITDAHGNGVPGVSVTFAVTGGGGSVLPVTAVTTNASGVATATSWTLGNTAGANTLSASATGLTTVSFTATGVAGAPANFVKSAGDAQSATAGSAVAIAPSVTVTDAHANPVSGVAVTFAVASGGGSVNPVTAVSTNASGIATVTSWTLGTTVGANSLTAAATGLTTLTFTATGTPGAPASIAIVAGDAQTANSGAAVATAPSVVVKDANNNVVPGVTVTFSVTGGGGGATGPTPLTNASGVATVGSWTLGSGGAGCSASAIGNCSRNALHAVATGGSAPAVDFKGYIPPILPATATYQAVGNTTLPIASNIGLLAGAFSINGPLVNGTGAALTFITPAPAGSAGGTVTIFPDGGFSYRSATATASATETFSYTVTDGIAASTTTASLAVNVTERVWYVDNTFGGAATGSDVAPFTSVGAAATAAAPGDTILVRTGSGTTTGGTLKASQVLYGQGASAARTFTTGSIATYRNGGTVITLLAAGGAPSIGALTLGSGNALRGFISTGGITGASIGALGVSEVAINNLTGQALSLSTGTLTGSFTSVQSTGGTNNISLTAVTTTGTSTLGTAGDVLTGATGDAVVISGQSGSFTIPANISNTTSLAVNVSGKIGGVVTFSGSINPSVPSRGISVTSNNLGTNTIVFSGSPVNISSGTAAGVTITGNTLATVSFTGGQLAIATSTGTPFTATGGGTVEVTGGSNVINASGAAARAVNLNGVKIGAAGMAFSTITAGGTTTASAFTATSVTNTASSAFTAGSLTVAGTTGISSRGLEITSSSAPFTFTTASINGTGGEGIYLNGNTAAVAVNGGTVGNTSNTTGDALSVTGGNANVSVAATLTKTTAGRVANLQSHTAGAITVSGALSCTGTCTGINVASNSGGTIDFTSGTKTLTTGGSAAVTLSSNTGATINFSGGGLAITTTTGAGFDATAGGTVTVTTGANPNTISSGTGRGLNVDATAIGASGLTFRSVSHSGGTNGIALVSTGVAGGLTVTGDGSTPGSGGTITNTVGADGAAAGNGIYLSAARNVSLAWMALSGHANNGVMGVGVRNLTIDHMRLTGNNGSSNSGAFEESPVHLTDASGAIKVTGTRMDGGAWDGFLMRNTSGAPVVDSLVLASDTVSTMQGSLADGRNTALQAIINSGSADVRMRNNVLTYWWGNAIQVLVGTGASGTARITNNVANQTSGALAGAGGIWVNGGNLAYNISGNTVNGTNGTAISADKGTFNTNMNGTIDGNFIGTSGVANSGSGTGIGIFASHIGPSVTTVKISNNIIRQINGSANGAITTLTGDDVGGGGAGTMNATIVGNNIQESGTVVNSAQQGILVTNGRVTGDSDVGCYDIGGGTAALKNTITNFNTAAGGTNVNRMRMNIRFVTTARFPGYTGANNDNAGMGTYLLGRNTASNTANANNVAAGGSGYVNTIPAGSACTQPTM